MNESYYLLRFLLLLICDFFDTNANELKILQMLAEISLAISAFSFTDASLAYLTSLIRGFFGLCREVYPELGFTVKLHHLIHYPSMINKFSPLRYLNTKNFDAHHSFLKSLMRTS